MEQETLRQTNNWCHKNRNKWAWVVVEGKKKVEPIWKTNSRIHMVHNFGIQSMNNFELFIFGKSKRHIPIVFRFSSFISFLFYHVSFANICKRMNLYECNRTYERMWLKAISKPLNFKRRIKWINKLDQKTSPLL